MIYESITETIGNTPVIHIKHFAPDTKQVYLKIEGFNPTSSIKDRAAIYMIRHAEETGLLKPGGTIIESTSGNFGKSLAMIGAARGYKVIVVADPKISHSTLTFYQALGATVEMVSEPDQDGNYQKPRVERVKQLLKLLPNSYWPDQYSNPNNPRAHVVTTAEELLADFDQIDVLIASVSTGGHISGIAKALKQNMPNIDIVAVDAVGSSIFTETPYQPYLINGIGLSWCPVNLDMSIIDRVQFVSDVEAFSASQLLAQHEGILIGGSGGAVLFACLCEARIRQKAIIVAIIPDSGSNYLEEIFDKEWLTRHNLQLITNLNELLALASRPSVPLR